MRCQCATMWQTLYAFIAIHISLLDCISFNRIAQKRTIRESLILCFAKPYIETSRQQIKIGFRLRGSLFRGEYSPYQMRSRMVFSCRRNNFVVVKTCKPTYYSSMEVSPSRMAYFVRAAMVCRSSFFIICLRWVSMVFTLT